MKRCESVEEIGCFLFGQNIRENVEILAKLLKLLGSHIDFGVVIKVRQNASMHHLEQTNYFFVFQYIEQFLNLHL